MMPDVFECALCGRSTLNIMDDFPICGKCLFSLKDSYLNDYRGFIGIMFDILDKYNFEIIPAISSKNTSFENTRYILKAKFLKNDFTEKIVKLIFPLCGYPKDNVLEYDIDGVKYYEIAVPWYHEREVMNYLDKNVYDELQELLKNLKEIEKNIKVK